MHPLAVCVSEKEFGQEQVMQRVSETQVSARRSAEVCEEFKTQLQV